MGMPADIGIVDTMIGFPAEDFKQYDFIRKQLKDENRIITDELHRYNAGEVVFQPKNMSPEKLQELYHYSWETFYHDEPQTYKMYKLYKKVMGSDSSKERTGVSPNA